MMTLSIQQIIFYLFSVLAVGSGFMVVISRNPVRSALFLVLAFFASAGIWLLAQAEFLALALVLVYVGAVMTLFLFVVMMLNIDIVTLKRSFVRYLPIGILVLGLLLTLMFMAFRPEAFLQITPHLPIEKGLSNTESLGILLYTHYVYGFEIAAVLLLVAIIAAISLTHREPRNCKSQQIVQQIKVRREDRIRLVKRLK